MLCHVESQRQPDFAVEERDLCARKCIPARIDGNDTGLYQYHAIGMRRAEVQIVADQHHRALLGVAMVHGADELGNIAFVEPCSGLVERHQIAFECHNGRRRH